MFVRLCARETKWLTKCWSKLSLLTNHTVYEKLVYRNEVLKAMLKDSTTPSLPNPLAVFTQIFSIRFPHYLRAWKRLQVVLFFICISLHSCRMWIVRDLQAKRQTLKWGSQWGGGIYGYRLKSWLFYGYRLIFFQLRLTKELKINCFSFKKLNIN